MLHYHDNTLQGKHMKFLSPLVFAIATSVSAQQTVIEPEHTPATVNQTQTFQATSLNSSTTMPKSAWRARSRLPVKFIQLNDSDVARLSGHIRGLEMDIYHFYGNAGDVIDIINQHGKAMEYAIFRPDMGMRFGAHQVLPQTGEYELRIVNNRKNAARNKAKRAYAVTFRLIGNNGQEKP